MIQVTVYVDSQERIVRFHTYGHAEYAQAGSDIICSAVSAIVLTTVNSIEALTEDAFICQQEQETGEITVSFETVPGHDAQLLMQAMLIGLKGISNEYGAKYLKVNTKEV